MSLPSRLLGANPSIQVSALLSGSLSTPSAKGVFVEPTNFESIASSTATGSSITFSSIPSTYVSLQIRFNIITNTVGDAIGLRFNGDSGANYRYHVIAGCNSVVTATGTASAQADIRIFGRPSGTIGTYPNVGIIDILDYASTTKYKTVRTFSGADNNITASSEVEFTSGVWFDTTAVNSISLQGVTFSAGSTYSLYGIKG